MGIHRLELLQALPHRSFITYTLSLNIFPYVFISCWRQERSHACTSRRNTPIATQELHCPSSQSPLPHTHFVCLASYLPPSLPFLSLIDISPSDGVHGNREVSFWQVSLTSASQGTRTPTHVHRPRSHSVCQTQLQEDQNQDPDNNFGVRTQICRSKEKDYNAKECVVCTF